MRTKELYIDNTDVSQFILAVMSENWRKLKQLIKNRKLKHKISI